MFYCHANGFASLKTLGGRYWCSKEQSYDQRTLNLISLFIKKRRTANGIILVLTNIVVVMLGLLSILLGMTNIVLQNYHFQMYQ